MGIIQISCLCQAVAWNLHQVSVELDSWVSLEKLQGCGQRFHSLSEHCHPLDWPFPPHLTLSANSLRVCFGPQARLIIKTLSSIDPSSSPCVILRRDNCWKKCGSTLKGISRTWGNNNGCKIATGWVFFFFLVFFIVLSRKQIFLS